MSSDTKTKDKTKHKRSGQPGQYSAVSFTPDGNVSLLSRAWVDDAACRTVDTDLFFPKYQNREDAAPTHGTQYEAARKVCSQCEVRDQCLAAVMEAERGVSVRYGMFAGLSPVQRRALASETPQWQKRGRRKPTF